jgi:hypothetical protein
MTKINNEIMKREIINGVMAWHRKSMKEREIMKAAKKIMA